MLIKNNNIKIYSFYGFLILLASALIQTLLIVYKHYIGYVPIQSILHFIVMLSKGTALSWILLVSVLLVDLKLIKHLNRLAEWSKNLLRRFTLELISAFFIGAVFGILFTIISEYIFGYEQPLSEVFISNFFIAAVINLLVISVTEAILYYQKNRQAILKAEILERENVSMRFEMLKKQLDPHFLFNSLNILSSLVKKDSKKSQEFIDAFSSVYRYTLEVIEKPVVRLEEEIEFSEYYLFLQKLRFEGAFSYDLLIDKSALENLLPPLSLQVLLENAFKHNVVSLKEPLHIKIHSNNSNEVIVSNHIQLKTRIKKDGGVGFENLKNRYRLISEGLPQAEIKNDNYIVTLPLIRPE